MGIFFTSDTHFGPTAIIKLCNRPFSSVEEMDEAMIARWNAMVGDGDIVYHLGDFCYRNARGAENYIRRLNGEIHLIAGNHDAQTLRQDSGLFASVRDILEIRVGDRRIVLCHYPMREWHNSWSGSWHFFGHVHGRLNAHPLGYSLDVGVDSHDFRLWTLAEIEEALAERRNPFLR